METLKVTREDLRREMGRKDVREVDRIFNGTLKAELKDVYAMSDLLEMDADLIELVFIGGQV